MLDLMLCLGRRSKRNKDTIGARMLVSETSIFGRQTLTVLLVSAEGREWYLDVEMHCAVDQLKLMALAHFYHPAETLKAAAHFQLVLVDANRKLNDDLTLAQEGVKDNDELLLLKKIVVSQSVRQEAGSSVRDSQWKGADAAGIKLETSQLPSRNANRVAEDSVTVVNFQVELRKALVSLIDCAQRIQMMNETVLPLFNKTREWSATEEAVDAAALKQLTDMGFSRQSATKALVMNAMSAVDALESLIGNAATVTGAHDFVAAAAASPVGTVQRKASWAEGMAPQSKESSSQEASGERVAADTTSESPHLPSLPELMEAFRAYKRREFRPNHKAFTNLREMGFDQEKIADALRVSGNNQDAAFEWLISQWPTAQDFSQGLDPEGPIHSAIMANPVIRLALDSPKVLYAFLHMLENPNCATHWLNDPDAAPLLGQIFKIYHAEKYSLQIGNS